jgi:hypothetical protein
MGSLSIWHWIVVLTIIFIFVLPLIFYIRSYLKTARVVNRAGGSAPTGSAWLLLIPLFGIAWFFVLLIKLKEAIRLAGIKTTKSLWWTSGLIAGGLYVFGFVATSINSFFSILVGVGWLVFAIFALGRTQWSESGDRSKRSQRVGWVEPLRNPSRRPRRWVSLRSTHPTG